MNQENAACTKKDGARNVLPISNVRVHRVFPTRGNGALKAVGSVTLGGQLAVHDLRVVSNRARLFAAMPNRKGTHGVSHDTAHPISRSFRNQLEQ